MSFGPGVFFLKNEVSEMEKEFKKHDDLIKLLEERGIDFSASKSKSEAKKKLQRIGYYNLINGYSSLFFEEGKKDCYLKGTTIHEIFYNLQSF